jgi:DNA (cytosine-5)-methyltransferase 1
VAALAAEGRPPAIVAIENVCGFLTAGFPAIADALVCTGYRVGAIMADAALWAPQSRPRIFVVAVHRSCPIPPALRSDRPCLPWHPPALLKAVAGLSAKGCDASQWWRLPDPPPRVTSLADIIEGNAPDTPWHSRAETAALVRLMSPTNFAKIEAAQRVGCRVVMAGFRRMRGSAGQRTQRFEARDDGLAGALRMPTGGSSRQILLVIEGAHVRSRLMSGREAMRLMGAPDTYRLPPNLNDALALAGDAVAVPVVAFLRQHLFEPLLAEDPASIAEEKPAHA